MRLPFWITCTTCQPPRPSGTCTVVFSVPSAPAVAVPSGTDTNVQHVPAQLTRLPTTVDHSRSTGWPAVRPVAVRSAFVSTGPLVVLRLATAVPAVSLLTSSVVLASTVGATFAGQSIAGAGRPLSFVTLNANLKP